MNVGFWSGSAVVAWLCFASAALLADAQNFSQVLDLSFRFYEAQMSGDVPSWSRAARGQPGGWRNRSHMLDGTSNGGIGVDLSGGWYDAGDHLKLHLPLGMSASFLAYGALTWEPAVRAAGQWDIVVRNLDWVASYFVKCHYQSSATASANAFVAQVGDGGTDHSYWGRPEEQPATAWRPAYAITAAGGKGADIVAEAAATLAGVSLLLRRPGAYFNPTRAATLLGRAQQLFAFAQTVQATWGPPSGENLYSSSSFNDDVAWAAAWLCRAEMDTGAYASATASPACNAALPWWDRAKYGSLDVSWDNAMVPAALLLRDTGAGGAPYVASYDDVINRLLTRWQGAGPCASGGSPCLTPGGLAWHLEWGSNRYAANVAFAALAASRSGGGGGPALTRAARVGRQCWARAQLGYMLGANPQQQSFVVGYRPTSAHKAPERPHHRSSSCPLDPAQPCGWGAIDAAGPNPGVLAGALVGGPDRSDVYVDNRRDYQKNEVAVDFNAGFTAALMGLTALEQALQRSGCTWAAYCALTCDIEQAGPAPPNPPPRPSPKPPPPSPSPKPPSPPRPPIPRPPSPSPKPKPPPPATVSCNTADDACKACDGATIANGTACRTCVAAMRAGGYNAYMCTSSCGPVAAAGLEGVCSAECVPAAAPRGADWACGEYCGNATAVGGSVAIARQCAACVRSAPNAWDCSHCLGVALSITDPATAAAVRSACIECATTRSISGAACGTCSRLGSAAQRSACMDCVGAGGGAEGCAQAQAG
ncbi:hypothetical protein HYH03_016391 [Edaphochlamys debaryana]|uniref:Endoglucanase n=1 Tax=Edaphochlamys debaryana TaxID=47281 RepID=A0A836BRH7_9CHLO|nr:hypothetical protein HYH03_016391 [Edaphochlamys debaryana]|eukprot:KAG2484824.1 hypothetical protein HYH03_016391 [Edaphochlamys debaryana]